MENHCGLFCGFGNVPYALSLPNLSLQNSWLGISAIFGWGENMLVFTTYSDCDVKIK